MVRVAADLGISKIRLTGGEPLLRKDLTEIISAIAELDGIEDLSCTTNGFLLEEKADQLAAAGLNRVNVSVDTLRPERFQSLARRGELPNVMAGIEAAFRADLTPVKVNCVAMRGFNDDEAADFARWTMDREIHVRFIELMPMRWNLDEMPELGLQTDGLLRLVHAPGGMLSDVEMRRAFISAGETRSQIESAFGALEEANLRTNGPARTYRVPGAAGTIGFISQITSDFCSRCNRLRLTHDGFLRPCLMSDGELDLRTALRSGANDEDIATLFRHAVLHKPERHYLADGQRVAGRGMSQIGG